MGLQRHFDAMGGPRFASREHVESSIARSTPSKVGDEGFALQSGSFLRLSATPTSYETAYQTHLEMDVRHVLPAIRPPMLVLHRSRPEWAEPARYVAQRVRGARTVEVPGDDAGPYYSARDVTVAAIGAFLTDVWKSGAWEDPEPDRVLATVLFTDIVGSTERAADLGDRAWAEVLREHHALIRRQLLRFRGREVDTAGDGFFATFDGPARAIRCALAIVECVAELGLEVRAGLHTGECELIDGKVGGIAVHLGGRVAAQGSPGEVIVSSTVKDLVAGSGIDFEPRGEAELKGVPGDWQLFAAR
jgi:class 3 adenylate cyclase